MPKPPKIELHLHANETITALSLLSAACDLNVRQIKQAAHNGALWLELKKQKPRRLRRVKRALHNGDQLHFYYDPDVQAQQPTDAKLIADQGDYSVWDKPSGMFVQPSKWADHCSLGRYVETHLTPQRSVYLVHRLDRATSGLIVVAHKKAVVHEFTQLFAGKQIRKIYRAKVCGRPDFDENTVDAALDGRAAISHLRLIHFNPEENRSLLEVRIESGRKHQIRRHLQSIGLPIIGDRLYGDNEQTEDLQLQATQLEFICPLSGEARSYQVTEPIPCSEQI